MKYLGRFLVKHWQLAIIFFIFFCIAAKSINCEFFDLGGDSAQYITVAESVAQGNGYRMINSPSEPVCFLYPPVFPVLLSAVVFFFGRNIYLMYWLVAVLGFFGLVIVYKLLKKTSASWTAFLTVCFLSFNWGYLSYCTKYIRSEMPYLFLSAFTLLIFGKYKDKESFINAEAGLCTAGVILSYFTRYIGITLFASFLVTLLISRNRTKFKKSLLMGSTFLLFFLLWTTIKYLYGSQVINQFKLLFITDLYDSTKGTLFQNPLNFINRFVEGVNFYSDTVACLFSCYPYQKWNLFRNVFPFIFILVILLGFGSKFREDKKNELNYYLMFYFLLIIFWPARETIRFLIPVLPFMVFYFFIGLQNLLKRLPAKVYLYCFSVVIIILFWFNALSLPLLFAQTFRNQPQIFKNFIRIHQWIEQNIADKGIILSRKPTVSYFYTGHQAIVYPYTRNSEEIWKEIIKNNVKYIIVDEFSQETYRYLLPFIYTYGNKLKYIDKAGNTALFEVVK